MLHRDALIVLAVHTRHLTAGEQVQASTYMVGWALLMRNIQNRSSGSGQGLASRDAVACRRQMASGDAGDIDI
jgi:hypothetical protein